MRLHLSNPLVNKLAALPETGMGYQLVDLVLRDGREVRKVMVFNAEEAEVADASLTTADIADVRLSARPH